MTDIECTWTPSFVIVTPITEAGLEWMRDNTAGPHGDESNIGVDHRYIADIVIGARDAGLTVDTTN